RDVSAGQRRRARAAQVAIVGGGGGGGGVGGSGGPGGGGGWGGGGGRRRALAGPAARRPAPVKSPSPSGSRGPGSRRLVEARRARPRDLAGLALGTRLARAAPDGERQRLDPGEPDELLAVVAHPVVAAGEPLERRLDLRDLAAVPVHERHLDLIVEGLGGPHRDVRRAAGLRGAALAHDGPHGFLELSVSCPQELLDLLDRPSVQPLLAHRSALLSGAAGLNARLVPGVRPSILVNPGVGSWP